MKSLDEATRLKRAGRFSTALKVAESEQSPGSNTLAAQLLTLELLERVGRHSQALTSAQLLCRSKGLSDAQRGVVEYVLGRLTFEAGDTDTAIDHLHRAISLAKGCDLELTCWSQISLLLILADRSGPQALIPLLAEVRLNTTKHGDARTMAGLHVFVGEMEAKYGHLNNAQRHGVLAQKLLLASENVWLAAVAENLLFGVSILRSDPQSGLQHGLRALELAETSGAASTIRACLGNLGNVFQILGNFDRSVEYFNRALAALPSNSEKNHAAAHGLVQTLIELGRLDECSQLLGKIRGSILIEIDRAQYAHRNAQLTHARLLARQGRITEALDEVEYAHRLGQLSGDELLGSRALLTKAELQSGFDSAGAVTTLNRAISDIPDNSPSLFAQVEKVLAIGLATTGDIVAAERHCKRARRVFETLPSIPELRDLERCWESASRVALGQSVANSTDTPTQAKQHVLEGVSAMMSFAGRPELIAREVVDLLNATDCARSATAVTRAADGSVETLANAGEAPSAVTASPDLRVLAIGTYRDRTIEILIDPKPDMESAATVNSIGLLLGLLHELERSRAEREERATLWPVDEIPIDNDHAITTGYLKEVMSLARKIATTDVAVLVTGESGTGKEVVARAIHAHSKRAHKPFVPFNCAAVPRELLESQLFGHRRGAFTGADRDHPGIIRAAQHGTLFLDEVGELGLDLQPKLLRFLESGEICPLGESMPFTVDVRIVAATNTNLEAAVRERRFREDLFYRLNVVPLSLKPLRDRRDEIPMLIGHFLRLAVEEFRKQHVRLAEETFEHLLLYAWPGNVRQLQNEVRRMVALAEPHTVLGPSAISQDIQRVTPLPMNVAGGGHIPVPFADKLAPTLARVEREMITLALRDHRGRVDATARALGISRKGLYLKRQRLGL